MKITARVSSHNDRTISVSNEQREIAQFRMDYLEQIDEIVILPHITPEERTAAIRLAASHVRQYMVERRYPAIGGLLIGNIRNQPMLSRSTSRRLLDPTFTPKDIRVADTDELVGALRKLDVFTVEAAHRSVVSALDAVVTHELLADFGAVTDYQILKRQRAFDDSLVTVRFSSTTSTFTFWKSMDKPGSGWDLHIVPDYHPVMRNKQSRHLINGDTNALIGGYNTVRYVRPPTKAKRPGELWPGGNRLSFADVNHPVCARGTSFEADISVTRILAREGIELVASLLADALRLDGRYVSVSGGFRSPYAHPANLVNAGLVPGVREARGSEDHCFWTYRTLQAEGASAMAHVPDWFDDEGWTNAYERFNRTM